MFLTNQCWDTVSMLCSWQSTLPSHVSLDSGVNLYVVRQRWQCVWYVHRAEMAAGLYSLRDVEMTHDTEMNRSSDNRVK